MGPSISVLMTINNDFPADNITWSPRGYNVTFRGGNVVVLRNYHVTLSTLSYVVTTWHLNVVVTKLFTLPRCEQENENDQKTASLNNTVSHPFTLHQNAVMASLAKTPSESCCVIERDYTHEHTESHAHMRQ